MHANADKGQNNQNRAAANEPAQSTSSGGATFEFIDNRAEAVQFRKLQAIADNSPQAARIATQGQVMAANHPAQPLQPFHMPKPERRPRPTLDPTRSTSAIEPTETSTRLARSIDAAERSPLPNVVCHGEPAQREVDLVDDRAPVSAPHIRAVAAQRGLQGSKFEAIQRQGPEEEELLQGKFGTAQQAKETAQLQAMADSNSVNQQPTQKSENNTGLPDDLKSGMENLSGMSLDDVKVHRNSDKPAQLLAHGYPEMPVEHEHQNNSKSRSVAIDLANNENEGMSLPAKFAPIQLEKNEDNSKSKLIAVGAQKQNPDLLEFIKLRAKSKFRNEVRKKLKFVPGVRAPKSSEEHKKSTAKRIVKKKAEAERKNLSRDEERMELVSWIRTKSQQVGHAWIELGEKDSGPEERKSYGHHPIKPGKPNEDVAGIIKSPDVPKTGGSLMRKTYDISQKTYDSISSHIEANRSITYNLISKNCTTYARDIIGMAGLAFPDAATVIPYGPLGIMKQRLWNPNELHDSIAEEEEVAEEGEESEVIPEPDG